MIISRTPFRISFFGGGTDYPAWYRKHGGAVLATTINKYCYITCRYLPPFFEHQIRLMYSQMEQCQSIDEIKHPSIREVLRLLNVGKGVEIHHDADVPARSGMGSSSSFTVGLLHSLYGLLGTMPDKHRLMMESIHVEQNILKETVGSQDQALAAYGGFNHVLFSQNDTISVRPVTISQDRISELNSHLMLFYTGIKRTASDVASSYVNKIEDRKRQLLLMKDMVDESLSVINSGNSITQFGKLLHEAWLAKRSLSKQVTNSHVDEIYDLAKSQGAIGGKLTGAGGGGFMLLFVPPERQLSLRKKLDKLIYVPFRCESSGSQIIFFDPDEDYSDEEMVLSNHMKRTFREWTEIEESSEVADL